MYVIRLLSSPTSSTMRPGRTADQYGENRLCRFRCGPSVGTAIAGTRRECRSAGPTRGETSARGRPAGRSKSAGLCRARGIRPQGRHNPKHGDRQPAPWRPRPRHGGFIIYTSGTTAHPKGCMLSHEAVTRGPVERARHRLGSGNHDVTWASGPLCHIGSLGAVPGLCRRRRHFPDRHLFRCRPCARTDGPRKGNSRLAWFSAIVQALLDQPGFDFGRLDSLLSLFMIAPAPLVERAVNTFPRAEILQACGMTETAGVFALSLPTRYHRGTGDDAR